MGTLTQPASAAVIQMDDVTIGSLRDVLSPVVERVDWTVRVGDYWVVAGLQGAGKSDLLMTAASLVPPLAGEYRFFGERMPIFEEPRLAHRLRLGLVFETGQLFHTLTVRENIALPLRYHQNLSSREALDRVSPWLKELELEPWADSTPGALGRNWVKRVALARALVLEPELVLADNPLGGLDLRHSQWWLGFFDALKRGHPLLHGKPITMVATTADLRPWKNRAKQFAILREKRFTVLGTWQQLEAASTELLHELLLTETTG
jgi:phospholipid/cholesterol/gamma-HCH transport system ATP-binding protein